MIRYDDWLKEKEKIAEKQLLKNLEKKVLKKKIQGFSKIDDMIFFLTIILLLWTKQR